jgi:hypothetical protein
VQNTQPARVIDGDSRGSCRLTELWPDRPLKGQAHSNLLSLGYPWRDARSEARLFTASWTREQYAAAISTGQAREPSLASDQDLRYRDDHALAVRRMRQRAPGLGRMSGERGDQAVSPAAPRSTRLALTEVHAAMHGAGPQASVRYRLPA